MNDKVLSDVNSANQLDTNVLSPGRHQAITQILDNLYWMKRYEQIPVLFELEYNNFHSCRCISNHRL